MKNTLFSFAYPPNGMNEKEFIDVKINWMIDQKRSELVEKFLSKITHSIIKKIIQYLVDENIARANIKEGCQNKFY